MRAGCLTGISNFYHSVQNTNMSAMEQMFPLPTIRGMEVGKLARHLCRLSEELLISASFLSSVSVDHKVPWNLGMASSIPNAKIPQGHHAHLSIPLKMLSAHPLHVQLCPKGQMILLWQVHLNTVDRGEGAAETQNAGPFSSGWGLRICISEVYK